MSSTRGLLVALVFLGVTTGSRQWAAAEQSKAEAAKTAQPAPSDPSPEASASTQKPKAEQPVPASKPTATQQSRVEQKASQPSAQSREPAREVKVEAPVAEPLVEAAVVPSSSGFFLHEPSLYETGRVGQMGVSDSGVRIKQQQQDGAKPKEARVGEKAVTLEGAGAGSQTGGLLNAAVLGREIRPRFTLLKDCPIEVARQKRTDVTALAAGSLTLRWTVLQSGQVTDTQVVATSPVDPRIVDCVKRQMSFWSFSPPTGGPARVERAFKFQ